MKGRNSKLLLLSFLAMVLFNFPLVNLLKDYRVINVIPAILVYLLVAWLAVIIIIAVEVSRKK